LVVSIKIKRLLGLVIPSVKHPQKADFVFKLALLTLADVCICERNELVEDDDYSLNSRDFQRFSNILDIIYLISPLYEEYFIINNFDTAHLRL
jgi:hypothetical protein